jgi:hypothetical protein
MRRRLLVPVLALAFAATGVIASCTDEITAIDRSFEENATWVATLNGANERPTPVTTPATGEAFFVDNGTSITYFITYRGLTTNATASHIHVGTAEQAGGIIIDLPPPNPSVLPAATSGEIAGTINMTATNVGTRTTAVSPQQLRDFFNTSGVYVNVHSTQYGGGEIRGQVRPR